MRHYMKHAATALALLALACSSDNDIPTELPPCAQDGEDSDCPGGWEEELEIVTFTSYQDHGTDVTERVTLRELAAQNPDAAEAVSRKLRAPGEARQALSGSGGRWTDNEVYHYSAVYPSTGGPFDWATIPMFQAKNYLQDASLITGIVISDAGPSTTPRDGRIVPNEVLSSSCATGGLCRLGVASLVLSSTKILWADIIIDIANIGHYYGASPNRAHEVRKTVIHEVGHGMGLKHFSSGLICNASTGDGAVCPWGSRPGGRDTVMSYCAPPNTNGFDGCELEELYWNVSPGTEF
jgi:hypothetical protein